MLLFKKLTFIYNKIIKILINYINIQNIKLYYYIIKLRK